MEKSEKCFKIIKSRRIEQQQNVGIPTNVEIPHKTKRTLFKSSANRHFLNYLHKLSNTKVRFVDQTQTHNKISII